MRKHVIADISLNYLAYKVVKHGFTVEVVRADYGYDGTIITYDADGEVENGMIQIQLKATDSLKFSSDRLSVLFRVSRRDLDLWDGEPFPVYLILFATENETAYWVYIQQYLQANKIEVATLKNQSLTVPIDVNRQVNSKAIASWQADKARALEQIGQIDHA